jgi:DNA polymerase-3 subunit delta'
MQFSKGRTYQNHLTHSADLGRIPYAIFVDLEVGGTLPMAIAYAQYIVGNTAGENNGENQLVI